MSALKRAASSLRLAALLLCALGVCAQPAPERPLVTVVSGYWNLSVSKHSARDYAAWFNTSLRVAAPYVFYYGAAGEPGAAADAAAEGVRAAAAAARGALPTRFVRRDVRSFSVAGSYDAAWVNGQHVPSAELALVWLEKLALLTDAAAADPAGADWLAWVDAGAACYRTAAPPPGPWPDAAQLATLPIDRLIYSGTRSSLHDVAGTAFMLHRTLLPRLPALFAEQRALCALRWRDWRCGSDQVLFTAMRDRYPSLFYRLAEGYGAVVEELYRTPTPLPPAAAYWASACATRSFKPLAIATLVTTPAYVEGANVLWASLRQTLAPQLRGRVDFVALLVAEHGEAEANATRQALHGWTGCVVPLIPPPYDGAVSFPRFREQFTKLALWNATMYERVLYMDSDTLALGDVSPLLALPASAPFAAVRDWENGAVRAHFNMGVASLAPSAAEFTRLDAARATRRDYRMGMAEQGLLNAEYGGSFQELPFEYNGNLAAAAQAPAFWANASATLRVIHYTWIKPFDPQAAKHRDYAACKAPLDTWLRARDDMLVELGIANATSPPPGAPPG